MIHIVLPAFVQVVTFEWNIYIYTKYNCFLTWRKVSFDMHYWSLLTWLTLSYQLSCKLLHSNTFIHTGCRCLWTCMSVWRLFWHECGSLLPSLWVSFEMNVGLFWHENGSLLTWCTFFYLLSNKLQHSCMNTYIHTWNIGLFWHALLVSFDMIQILLAFEQHATFVYTYIYLYLQKIRLF